MEKTEKFRMRRYSKRTATNIYAAPMRGVNKLTTVFFVFVTLSSAPGHVLRVTWKWLTIPEWQVCGCIYSNTQIISN